MLDHARSLCMCVCVCRRTQHVLAHVQSRCSQHWRVSDGARVERANHDAPVNTQQASVLCGEMQTGRCLSVCLCGRLYQLSEDVVWVAMQSTAWMDRRTCLQQGRQQAPRNSTAINYCQCHVCRRFCATKCHATTVYSCCRRIAYR